MNTKAIAISMSIAATFALAGCATTPAASVVSESTAPQASQPDAPTAAPAAPAAPVTAADVYASLPVPAGASADAALAWEALLGPEGEYAAAASYQAVLNTFGTVEPYATIYRQELKHIDALIRQLDRYGITAPANPYLTVVTAPADLLTAATAWADGEIANVAMYDNPIAASTDSRLTGVLQNLRDASLNSHLPLFQQAVANGGTTA